MSGRNQGQTLRNGLSLVGGIHMVTHKLDSCAKDSLKKFCWDEDENKFRIWNTFYSYRCTWMTWNWLEGLNLVWMKLMNWSILANQPHWTGMKCLFGWTMQSLHCRPRRKSTSKAGGTLWPMTPLRCWTRPDSTWRRIHFSPAANVDHSQKETCKARHRTRLPLLILTLDEEARADEDDADAVLTRELQEEGGDEADQAIPEDEQLARPQLTPEHKDCSHCGWHGNSSQRDLQTSKQLLLLGLVLKVGRRLHHLLNMFTSSAHSSNQGFSRHSFCLLQWWINFSLTGPGHLLRPNENLPQCHLAAYHEVQRLLPEAKLRPSAFPGWETWNRCYSDHRGWEVSVSVGRVFSTTFSCRELNTDIHLTTLLYFCPCHYGWYWKMTGRK